VQLPEHLPSIPHRLLWHGLVVGVVQAPEPLHTDAVVAFPSVQLAGVQIEALSGNAQALPFRPSQYPLQTPVPPQAVRVASGAPVTALHLPTEPVSLHDSHCPSHFWSQHTASTQ